MSFRDTRDRSVRLSMGSNKAAPIAPAIPTAPTITNAPTDFVTPLREPREPSVNESIKKEAYTRAMNRVDLMTVAKSSIGNQTA